MTNTGNRDRPPPRRVVVRWPARREDLVDTTHCPGCFEPLASAVCGYCGLDLRNPAAAELLNASRSAADALDTRIAIIGRIHLETDAAAQAHALRAAEEPARHHAAAALDRHSLPLPPHVSPTPTTLPLAAQSSTPPAPLPLSTAPPVGTAPPAGTPPPVGTAAAVSQPEPRRRVSSIQLALLIAGISLLSVFAIFFLVYAFINYGIIWRSVIIGAVTVAAFATASLLHRRGLRSTAEGIGVFAIVLVYLDAFAVRANDLSGAADADGALYWGTTVVIAAIGFVLWHRASKLRAPSLIGFVTFAPGIGIVTYGLTARVDDTERVLVVLCAIALAGVIHRLAGRDASGAGARVERSIVLATTVVALVVAILAAIFDSNPVDPTVSVVGLLAVIAIGVAHLAVLRSIPSGPRRWAGALAVPVGLAASSLGFAVWSHIAERETTLPLWPVVAVIAALGFSAASRRSLDALLRAAAGAAAVASAVVLGFALIVSLYFALNLLANTVTGALSEAWRFGASDPIVEVAVADVLSVVSLAGVGLLTAIAWRLEGLLTRRGPGLAWYGIGVLLLAAPAAGSAAAVMGAWLGLASLALIVLVLRGNRISRLRPQLATLYGAGLGLGWIIGWASQATWPVAAVTAIVLLVAGRMIVAGATARALFLAAGSLALLIGVATAVRQAGYATAPPLEVWSFDVARGVAATAATLVILAAVTTGARLSSLDRRVMFWMQASIAVVAMLSIRLNADGSGGIFSEPVTGVVLATLLFVAAVLWVAPPSTASFRVERMTASVGLAPALWLLLDAVLRALDVGDPPLAIAPAAAALIVAAASLIVTLRRPTRTPRNYRELGVALTAVGALALVASDDGTLTWVVLTVIAATCLLTATGQSQESLAAVGFGLGALLIPLAAATGARSLVSFTDAAASATADAMRFAAVVAVALLAVAALRMEPVVPALARRTVFWVSLVVIGVAEVTLLVSGWTAGLVDAVLVDAVLLDAAAAGLVSHVLLVGALVLWGVLRSTRAFRVERIIGSIALGPAVYLVVDSFVRVIDAPELARSVAPVTAALLSAAGSLAVALVRPPGRTSVPRGLREIGVAIVGAPAVLTAIVDSDGSTWLVLLIAAVAVLVLAISPDGLFASSSQRRQLGWGAVLLAVAGLWWRLSENSVSAVEPYVLPLAGILLLIALLLWRAGRRSDSPSAAPPVVALAALLVGILPVASVSATGSSARALAIVAVSAALLVLGSFGGARGGSSGPLRPYLDVAALAGAIGVTVTAGGRAGMLAWSRPDSFELDAWLGAGVLLLIVAGFGLAARSTHRFSRPRSLGARVIALVALTGATFVEVVAISRASDSLIRPLAVVLFLAAVHVIAFVVDRMPLDRLVAWLAIAYATIVAGVGLVTGALDPVEGGSIPLAVALIASGVVRLDESEKPRSWPWLGPGVILLLVPSLIATIDDRPLWRLVGIGVVGVAVIVVGVTRRLQAPFVIASVLVLVHAIATFAPQIRSVYESVAWWLWLGVGGVILTVLAARYEQRLKNLRDVVERIGSLR